MYLRLAIAAIIALALAASHWKAYVAGSKSKQAEWDKATLMANESARETERINRISKERALETRTKEIMANVAAANRARIASERLRDTSERSLQTARDNHAACVVSAAVHAELFSDCRDKYRSMGQAAEGHATDLKALIEAWPK